MNIGLLGFGVVGRGVYDMLADRDDIRAAWVLCRRDLGELTAKTTYDIQDILSDPAVDTVVEVMGGLHPAYEYVAAALRAGKNVVSSNKYLMCRYYDELNALAREHGAALRCTAAVGGGIQWLTNLEKAAHANHISRVWGILNGTTNYIMDAMHGSDVDFADVLAQAQALGYAEADPSADIDGLDIQRKLILSANVAFGVSLREADVPVFGIRNVRKADIARFQAHGCTCKLIATAEQRGGDVYIDSTQLSYCAIPHDLMEEMRSSVIFLGAILARCKEATICYPGGCELGPRPIDLHLSALSALGAEIRETGGELKCRGGTLLGSDVYLPMPSVGATENALLCACGADGVTTIYNAAREPEIVDLQNFINAMGGNVRGAGGSIITVEGGRALHGGKYRIIADRIVGATYLCAAACCGGEVRLCGVDPRPLSTVSGALSEAGCTVKSGEDDVFLQSDGSLRSIRPVRTAPYPGFPTDAQPVLMAALLKSAGSTVFVENIFENRYRHVDELARMGAEVRVAGRVAVVTGREHLHGARVKCTDLRAGAALVIAGLQADGLTRISRIEHIDRGYESIERDLYALGAHVRRETGT